MVGFYLLYGKEEFLKNEFITTQKSRLFPKNENTDFNFEEFDLADAPLAKALDFVKTAPFLSEKRLAVIRGLEELDADEKRSFVTTIKNLPTTSIVIAVAAEGTPQKNSFLAELSEIGQATACHTPFDKDLPQWILDCAKKKTLVVQKDAVFLLIERFGKDLIEIDKSLDALSLFVHPRKDIQRSDVQQLVGYSAQADVYALVDAIMERNVKTAYRELQNLLKEGARAFEIIAAVAGQLERVKKASYLVESGRSAKDIGFDLKIHPFFLDKLLKQVSRMTRERISQALNSAAECDAAMKTGALTERLAIEYFVLKIST